MKKASKISLVLAASLALGCAAVACDDDPGKTQKPQEPPKYTVTYEIGEGATGTAPESVEKAKDDKFNLPEYDVATAAFYKTGWTFDGWHDGTKKYDGGAEYTMPGSKVTFTAQWVANEYTVTFDLDYGGAPKIDSQTVEHGNTATEPDNVPSRGEHVTFEGWCVGSADGDAFDFNTPVTSNLDLVAKWTIEDGYYSVTYSAPDGATGTVPAEEVLAIDTMVTLPANPFTKTGWTFYGWKNLNAGKDEAVYYDEADEFAFNISLEFRAVFSKEYVGDDGYGEVNLVLLDDGYLTLDYGRGPSLYPYETRADGIIDVDDSYYLLKLDDTDSSFVYGDVLIDTVKTAKNGAVLTLDGFGIAKLGDHVGTYELVAQGWYDQTLTLKFGEVIVEDITIVESNYVYNIILNQTITIDGTDYVFEHIVEYPAKFVGKYIGTSDYDEEYVVEITDTKVTLAIDGKESEALVLSHDIEEDPDVTIEMLTVLIDGETWIITDLSEKDGLVETIKVWKDRWDNAECTRYVAPDPNATYTVTVVKSADETQAASVVGTIPTIENKAAEATFTIPADTFSLAHYNQTNWRVQQFVATDGGYWDTIATYSLDQEIVMPAGNIRIVPGWVANNVTITFDANGGSGTMADATHTYNTGMSLTVSNKFKNTFTAPDGKEFQGWALTPNGAVLANGTMCDAKIVSEQDTLTLYAVWDEAVSTALNIETIVGHWTTADNAHTLDIIANNLGSQYVQGAGILDGKYLVQFQLGETSNYVMDMLQSFVVSSLTYADSTITLTSYLGDPTLVFSTKTALNATAVSEFTGNWTKASPSQNWVITADKAYYGINLIESNVLIIGSHIAIYDGESYSAYVLGKNDDKLDGWYAYDSEIEPVAVEFNAGNFYTLTANGKLNQVVNIGATVNASKLPTIDDDGPISGWVIEGTDTAFDPTATLTGNTSITAVHSTSANIKTYTGSGTGDYSAVKSITINSDTNEIIFNNDSDTKITVTPETTSKGKGYHITTSQCNLIAAQMWIVVSDDGNTVKLYDHWNGPDEQYGSLTA